MKHEDHEDPGPDFLVSVFFTGNWLVLFAALDVSNLKNEELTGTLR